MLTLIHTTSIRGNELTCYNRSSPFRRRTSHSETLERPLRAYNRARNQK